MKNTGLWLLGLFVVAVTTAADRGRSMISAEAEPASVVEAAVVPLVSTTPTVIEIRRPRAPRPVTPVAPIAPEAPRAPEAPPAPAARSGTSTVAAVVQEAPRSRSSRRSRSRNRYPGPIPTPSEWEAPEGPVRIALQAGHWRAHEAPRELSGLRNNGTAWKDTAEWEVNLDIAERAAEMLREDGYEVDILPAVIPPGYRAHLFIAIHADGAADPNASGFRVAAPRRDATGRATEVVELMQDHYSEQTGIRLLPSVTRRMQNYYAFNFRRYEHALHPMTVAVILETGFVTSERDRRVIFDEPDRAARGILETVRSFSVTADPAGS